MGRGVTQNQLLLFGTIGGWYTQKRVDQRGGVKQVQSQTGYIGKGEYWPIIATQHLCLESL
jgi:hypothetical protein